VDAEHRAEGPEGVAAVLELLDGYELPSAVWEPEVLALRVKEYTPQWLDRLCFTGRTGWGRLTPPQNPKSRAFAPLRSSPVSLFARENLPHWLALSVPLTPSELAPEPALILKILTQAGALFFEELVRLSGLLPSRVEQALGELATQGWVTADSFEGLRALLIPSEKRAPFADVERKRRHKPITSIEFAGRWSLLRTLPASPPEEPLELALAGTTDRAHIRLSPSNRSQPSRVAADPRFRLRDEASSRSRDGAIEICARVLLRRYGVMFRRLLERESLDVSWYELGRVYRRLEARGEIRGGHFIGGVSGEQFALPEAIGLLRSVRKAAPKGELVVLSAADPLNLVGVLTPGLRIPAISANRVLLRDGLPIAALEAGQIIQLENETDAEDGMIVNALKVGKMPASLRPYYG
jgi:ATP-dependent Lhr-like helicase